MTEINNAFYDELGDKWYQGDQHPVSLLRAEAGIKIDYVKRIFPRTSSETKLLDVACGGGLVTIPLAQEGYQLTGVDLSKNSLAAANSRKPENAEFLSADARALPFEAASFDGVLILDFLEHIEDPALVLREGARVLKPGGRLVFSTFNRNWTARLLAVEALKWFPDSPPNVHVYSLFLKPEEVRTMGAECGLGNLELQGTIPRFVSTAFWSSVFRRRVHPDFSFAYTKSLRVGYLGCFEKLSHS